MLYLSMDCERIQGAYGLKGPISVEQSEQSIKNFASLVQELNVHAEFFVTPAAAFMHKELFKDLKAIGHTISLHIHVPSFRDWYCGQKIELANLSYEKQKKVILAAIEDFATALDMFPEGFRPGMGSANQNTFEILTAAGIKRGSMTIPGYTNQKYKVDWSGWPQIPHKVKTANGDFHNQPLTGNLWIDNNKICHELPYWLESKNDSNYLPIYTHNWVSFEKESFPSSIIKLAK